MRLKLKLEFLKGLVVNNKKIVENYFFMTILQILNSFFYLLIYPYLIRTLGGEGYGLFIFATSISTYFIFFINFGFDFPATKAIVENINDREAVENILSCVFTSKMYLFALSILIFGCILFLIPILRENIEIFLLCFAPVFSFIIFPQWYFQAIQKMKIVTYIQLGIKLLSLPLIFLFIKDKNDVILYSLIVSFTTIIGSVIAFLIVRLGHKLKIKFVNHSRVKPWFKDAFPFFLSTSAGVIKEQSITIIIGAFFGMKEVAIYDLASKIIIVPRTIFMSVNAAIFPKIISNVVNSTIKKIINIEIFISFAVIILIVVFGDFIVHILGGNEMGEAYYLAIFLSVTVMSWLVVGAYISFVFIPNKKYYFVSKNQVIALVSFFLFTLIGLFLSKSILVFGIALAMSGLTEIIYCKFLTKKFKLL